MARNTVVVALGITEDGTKTTLGLWQGSTENAALRTSLLQIRDEWEAELPPPVKIHRKTRNPTKTVGVSLLQDRTRAGTRVLRYVASWNEASGKKRKRSFSVPKYGADKARAMAGAARHRGVLDLMRARARQLGRGLV